MEANEEFSLAGAGIGTVFCFFGFRPPSLVITIVRKSVSPQVLKLTYHKIIIIVAAS